jgi:hypothetical protein
MAGGILEDGKVEKGALHTTPGDSLSFLNMATTVSTVVKSGAGMLHAIIINSTAAGTITVYDNTAGSGTKIATLKSSIVEGTYTFNLKFDTGLYVIPAAASNVTYVYR